MISQKKEMPIKLDNPEESVSRETIDHFFENVLGKENSSNVKTASCDMAQAYIGAIEQYCKNAELVMDLLGMRETQPHRPSSVVVGFVILSSLGDLSSLLLEFQKDSCFRPSLRKSQNVLRRTLYLVHRTSFCTLSEDLLPFSFRREDRSSSWPNADQGFHEHNAALL